MCNIFENLGLNHPKSLQIKVQDTGCGMTQPQLSKVLNPGVTYKKNGHEWHKASCGTRRIYRPHRDAKSLPDVISAVWKTVRPKQNPIGLPRYSSFGYR